MKKCKKKVSFLLAAVFIVLVFSAFVGLKSYAKYEGYKFNGEAKSYMLIYLDSTDASLSTYESGFTISFRNPWGIEYKKVEFKFETSELTVVEDTESGLDNPVYSTKVLKFGDKDYKQNIESIINNLNDFMWGHGSYTIGERPEKPENPELQELIEYLKNLTDGR